MTAPIRSMPMNDGTLHPNSVSYDGGITFLRWELRSNKWFRCEPPEFAKPEAHAAWRDHIDGILDCRVEP